VSAWKALEEAHITNLEQLKTIVPVIEQIHGIGPEMAQVIRDRVELLATRRIVRVRLIFPKRSRREK
jgi:ribosomal protein S13